MNKVLAGVGLSLALAGQAVAQVLPGLQRSEPLPPQPNVMTPGQQATAAGVGQCTPLINRMAAESVAGRWDQTSGWHRTNPGQHLFQSVVGMAHEGNPPDAMAAIIAAPVPAGGCDGATVRVFPLGGDCATVQTAIQNGGRFIGMMLNIRIMLDANNSRLMLLPGYNNTCIAVAVDSFFDAG